MDALGLARLQFAITTVYHFFFVPLTLGLSVLVAVMQTMYYRSGDEAWKKHTQFWGRLFLINFAMGVVTGIVQEFQFGMNWSEYSRFVGDIFGAPLAIEALLAFFLESTFLGLWFFGWDKLSKRVHLATIWLVALGSNLSAVWILIANSFMQQPVGYVLRNGHAEMTDFFALVTNSNLLTQFPHVFFSGIATAGFFVLGISAWHLARKSNADFFRRSFQLAALYGLIGIALVALVGHSQAQHMVRNQPMKMAAAEGLYKNEDPASFSLLTIGSLDGRSEVFAIRLPALLSLLAYNRFAGQVMGINDLQDTYVKQYGPGDYLPPVPWIYWSFRGMVGAGLLMGLIALVGLYLVMQNKIAWSGRFLQVLPWAILLPYLANSAGWLLTELGRQPWIVFGLMKTEQGVSNMVPGVSVLISLVLFTLVYGGLMVVDIYLLRRYARALIQWKLRTSLHTSATEKQNPEATMDLNTIWFILIAILFAGFFLLEGFDFGVGILVPFLGKNDDERRVLINAIGPFWDGNEVWLLTAGGAIFAAFPHWYATMFSGLYLALVLMLAALILRGVAFEFRGKDARPRWRNFWDWAIFFGSFVPALLWGVALGNLLRGVPIDAKMNYTGDFFGLLNPFALLTGLYGLGLMIFHGANFLTLRTEGELADRARAVATRLWLPQVILLLITLGASYAVTDMYTKLGVNPGVIPILGGVALLSAGWFLRRQRDGWAFAMTAISVVTTVFTIFMTLYPRVMISSTDPKFSLTIYNASSSPYTLTIMTVIAVIFVPIVLAYQGWTYYVFRKRVGSKAPSQLV